MLVSIVVWLSVVWLILKAAERLEWTSKRSRLAIWFPFLAVVSIIAAGLASEGLSNLRLGLEVGLFTLAVTCVGSIISLPGSAFGARLGFCVLGVVAASVGVIVVSDWDVSAGVRTAAILPPVAEYYLEVLKLDAVGNFVAGVYLILLAIWFLAADDALLLVVAIALASRYFYEGFVCRRALFGN